MKAYNFVLNSDLEVTAAARLEARLRTIAAVRAASIANGRLRLWLNESENAAQALQAVRAVLGRQLQQAAPLKNRRFSLIARTGDLRAVDRTSAPIPAVEDPEQELRSHKRAALGSLAVFAACTLLKKVNPALYAASGLMRGAGVLWMASGLIREGLLQAFREKRPNAETLTLTAVLASVAAGSPESSLTLLALSNFSEMLTAMAAQRACSGIKSLATLNVKDVWVENPDGSEVKVPFESVKPGMTVSFHSGELICVDGEILRGEAAIDEAAITGESAPRAKSSGERVYAGTNIRLGEIAVRVDKVGADTSLSRIVRLVEDAQRRQAPIQSYADRMAEALVPVSFIGAVIVYAATRDLQRVLNMLFIDFSCGLKLSTATAIAAAISRAAASGILVKGGSFIERASHIDTVILDKTGTITAGRPRIVGITCSPDISESALLRLTASAEMHSTHPLAAAVLDEVEKRGLSVPPHDDTRTVIARGIEAEIPAFEGCNGGSVLVGSPVFLSERGVALDLKLPKAGPMSTLIYVSLNGSLAGVIEVADPIRHEFKRAVNRLRLRGVEEIVMLTGDSKEAAQVTADALGLDGFKAQVLPEDKADFVMKKQGVSSVLMAGDGINDAPALAYADIGVAMGTGCTDTAMESADVTINSDDPLKLPELIAIGQRTMNLVHQNFTATIAINTAAMMLGALGMISPLTATVVHNASTLGVVLNSGRVLFDKKLR